MRIFQAYVIMFLRWSRLFSKALVLVLSFAFFGCGVKGDPIPPEKPPSLGRGKPTYKQATEEISLPTPPQIIFDDDKVDDGEENEDED